MRIAIDGMGGDHAPDEIVAGVLDAAPQLPSVRILLVGQKDRLGGKPLPENVEIVPASEVVGMDEEPVVALRGKPDSSLRVSLRLVKRGEADAVISAGNTGALVGGATVPVFGLGNLEGVKRPGIAVPIPTETGTCALIDAGANPNAKAIHLVQYAVMGSVYARYLRPDVGRPRVGLLNIGEEPKKGTDLQREAYLMLGNATLNFEFVGNIEPHRLFSGKADVVVADGFVGNLALKMAEGVKGFVMKQFSNGVGAGAGAAMTEAMEKANSRFDYTTFGGAPVLGVRGVVIKAHGRSRALAVTNALKTTAGFIEGKLNDHIVEELRSISWSTRFAKWLTWSKEGGE